MALSTYTKPQLFQRAINQVSKLNGLVEVIQDSEGNIKFQSTFDGKVFEDIPQAVGHIEATGINTYRVFGKTNQVGSRKGLEQVYSESVALSDRLKSGPLATIPERKEALQRLGLGFLIDQDIDIVYQKFNYGGDQDRLAKIAQSDTVKRAGIVNITDEGVTVLNYRVGKRVLTSEQAKDLKYVMGLGTLTDNFVSKVFGSGGIPEFGGFAKLPKRIQGMLSERDVSLTGRAVDDIISNKAYNFDDVSAFFRGLLGGSTTQEERFLLTAGLGLEESRIKSITKGTGLNQLEYRLQKQFADIAGFADLPAKDQADLLDKMKNVFTNEAGGDFAKFKEVIQQRIDSGGSSDLDLESLRKIQASFDGVEKMRDGEFVANFKIVDDFIDDLQRQKNDLIRNSTKLTPDDIQKISEIDSQLESLQHMRTSGEEGLDSAIARLNFPGGQGKGEMFLRKFGWVPKGLKDKLLIMPKSAVKNEVQGLPSILLNVAKSHAENIYADPLMLLYHQDYFSQDAFLKGAVNNVEKQMQSVQSFLETGALPEDVRKEIFGAINTQLKEDPVVVAKMDAAAKASYIRNRSEAKAIQEAILAGEDPRKIPALVRRITDHYAKNAFRIKQTTRGERVDLVMQDTMRLALRTYESSLESGISPSSGLPSRLFQSAAIDLSALGPEGARGIAQLGGTNITDLNLVQFRIQGNRMMLSGPNAHLYHHALGTFDLDDKGVPLMSTFKDANGNDRLAFMTMRQPTGFQERIFMQGDLTDTSTLRTILQKSSGDFSSLLNDADAVASLSDPKEQRILMLMRQAINEKGNLDTKGLSSEDIEKVFVKLRNGFGSKYGFQDMVRITNQDLVEMAVTKSSSALGLDKRLGGSEAYRDFLAKKGITPDKMPDYTRGNFVKLLAEEQATANELEIVRQFNRREGTSFANSAQIDNYIQSLSGVDKSTAQAKINTIMQEMGERMQKSAAIDVENSLGLYINRQAAAISMDRQVTDILQSLSGSQTFKAQIGGSIVDLSLEDFFRSQFSGALIPPSDAVDISKSLVGQMKMTQEIETDMRMLAKAADDLRGTKGISEAAVENIIKQYTGRTVRLGEAGQTVVSQMGKGVGFLRAMQLSQGVAADQLIGFDRALFGEGVHARIRKKDIASTVESVIVGAKEYLSQITDDTQKGIVQSFIDELSNATVEDAIAKIALESSSRYAVIGKYAEQSEKARMSYESLASYGKRLSRTGSDITEAFATAGYMSSTEALVESQKARIESLANIVKSVDEDTGERILQNVTTSEISGDLYRGLSAIMEAEPSGNILDAFDTLEATIRTQYGGKVANKILQSDTDIVGMEDALVKIREDAVGRRINTRTIRRVSDDAYDGIVGLASGEGFSGISTADITKRQAKDFIKLRRTMMADTGLSLADLGESQELYDFMRLRSGDVLIGEEQLSQQAQDVFARVRAEEELAAINANATSSYTVSGADIGDEARRIVADADAADDVTTVARGGYTRMQDFIKNGSLRELFNDKIIRGSAYAVAGLAAFGFIYSARKERTQDEMSGPPLLPGGSAYESDFPRNLPSISDLKYLNPTALGMQYKVNISGSQQDIEKMQYLANGVVGGNVDSTIYNSLPRLGRDPYSEVASRF